jgi:hypothetical protein
LWRERPPPCTNPACWSVSQPVCNGLQTGCRVGRELSISLKELHLEPRPDSGPGLLKRSDFPRERLGKVITSQEASCAIEALSFSESEESDFRFQGISLETCQTWILRSLLRGKDLELTETGFCPRCPRTLQHGRQSIERMTSDRKLKLPDSARTYGLAHKNVQPKRRRTYPTGALYSRPYLHRLLARVLCWSYGGGRVS